MLMAGMIEMYPQELAGLPEAGSAAQVRRRRDELVQFAYDSGMLHDVGMIAFGGIIRSSGRSWLEEERQMYHCHACAGWQMLDRCDSTRAYAQTALGHNAFYSGVGGYPPEYVRDENRTAVVTDIVSYAVYLIRLTDEQIYTNHPRLSVPEAQERMEGKAGTQFSPTVCSVAKKLLPEIMDYVESGEEQAYLEAYERLFRE